MEPSTFYELGYLGLFLGTFLAATILPFSADVIFALMLYNGYDPATSLACAVTGNWLGGLSSYALGYLGYWVFLEKFWRINKEKVDHWRARLQRFGPWPALITWFPILGDPIAITMGFLKINVYKVAPLMFVGISLRFTTILILVLQFPDLWNQIKGI